MAPASSGIPLHLHLVYSDGTADNAYNVLWDATSASFFRTLIARRKPCPLDHPVLNLRHPGHRCWFFVWFPDVVAAQLVPLSWNGSSFHEPASYLSSASTNGLRVLFGLASLSDLACLSDLSCFPWRMRSLPVTQQDHLSQYSLASESAASSQL